MNLLRKVFISPPKHNLSRFFGKITKYHQIYLIDYLLFVKFGVLEICPPGCALRTGWHFLYFD